MMRAQAHAGLELAGVLDTLADDLRTEAAAHVEDGAEHALLGRMLVDVAHELRATAAIYRVELAVRTGRGTEAAAALQDAEILQQQSPLADPGLQWSLERAMAATPDKSLRKRLRAISDGMEQAMDRGSDPGRKRGRR